MIGEVVLETMVPAFEVGDFEDEEGDRKSRPNSSFSAVRAAGLSPLRRAPGEIGSRREGLNSGDFLR